MIGIPSTFKVSFRALRVNKMRSGLTMLGIIIGVGAVITMVAIGTGASLRISQQIASVGSNLIVILPGSTTSGGIRMGSGSQQTLTKDDADAILKECPAVAQVAPIMNGVAQVVYGNMNWSTGVIGTTPSILDVRDWPLYSGRNFTEQDVRSATKVCLLGQTVVDNLFGAADPVGQIVRIKKLPFTVVGVLDRKGQSQHGQDQDDTIFIPVTTAQKKIFGTAFPGMVRTIMVKARSTEDLDAAERQITALLRQRHHIGPKADNDFSIRNLTQMMQVAEQSTRVMTLLLGAIASVSLLVGGIGIMNIMLVSVTERTREIGIRLAVGALEREVLLQFLIEAVVLSSIGGVMGIALALSASAFLVRILQVPFILNTGIIALSFVFSAAVGVVFGYLPARQAARLDPIEALRHE